MNYVVHLYPTVRVKVTGIEADSPQQAVQKAEDMLNLHEVLDNNGPGVDNVEHVEWDESAAALALVDPLNSHGAVMYDQSVWLDGQTYLPLIDGKTGTEQKAAAAENGIRFMTELLAQYETLTGIADEHGVRTLADLMYLQQAILKGGFIDHYPGESAVLEIVRDLPSGEAWAAHIKVESTDTVPEDETPAKLLNLEWHLRCKGVDESALDDLVHDVLPSQTASSVNNQGLTHQLEALLQHEGTFENLLGLLSRELEGFNFGAPAVSARVSTTGVQPTTFDALPWLLDASRDALRELAASTSPEMRNAGLGLFDKEGEIARWSKDHGKTHGKHDREQLLSFFEAVRLRDEGLPDQPGFRTEVDVEAFMRFVRALAKHYDDEASVFLDEVARLMS